MFEKLKLPLLLAVVLTLLVLGLNREAPSKIHLNKDAVILAFGDSLTYGNGAVEHAYPLELEMLLGRKVINAGVSGEVSTVGLQRLPQLLERYHPQVVILCHGGNDILRKSSKATLKDNLENMVLLAQESGAEVLVVGVPSFGLLGARTLPLYKEVALEKKTLYEGEILEIIEQNPALKSDQIHPNADGYKMMAVAFQNVLLGD